MQAAHMPSFAFGIAWPSSDSAELRRLRCPPAIAAAMDGAAAAFDRLREEARAPSAPEATPAGQQTPREVATRVLLLARDCMDYSWEELHAGPW